MIKKTNDGIHDFWAIDYCNKKNNFASSKIIRWTSLFGIKQSY